MNNLSPSSSQIKPRRRRDGLIWLILLALLLAIVPIGCVAEVALRLVRPDDDPFKDVGARSSLNAYAPFPPGLSYAAVDPNLPNLQATEIARREQQPRNLPGAVTIVPIAQVGPALSSIAPPTATPVTIPTPRPTVTPLPPPTDVAGGVIASPSPTPAVIIPGMTATPAPTQTPTTTSPPTRTPADAGQGTPTPNASRTPTVAVTATATIPVINSPTAVAALPTPSATLAPPTTTPSPVPTLTPTSLPPPTETPLPPPTETPLPIATPTETPPPTVTPTQTPLPIATPTETPPPTPTEEPLPPITIAISDVSLSEGNSGTRPMRFPVALSRPATAAVSVAFSTVPLSGPNAATPDVDFRVVSGTLTFNPGDRELFIDVPIIGDVIDEDNESFTVVLANPVGGTIARSVATGTIIDDDQPTVSFVNAALSVAEGNNENINTSVTVQVRMTGQIARPVTVSYATRDDSATSQLPQPDYVARSGQLTFNPGGPTTLSFTVEVIGNTRTQPDRSFFVDLQPSAAYTIANPGSATVTIRDDDQPSVLVTVSDAYQPENIGLMTFYIRLSDQPSAQVTVNYATAEGTGPEAATAGVDFESATGTLTFVPGGLLEQPIFVRILDDDEDELDEFFRLNLTGVTGPAVAGPSGTGIIVDDDGPDISIGPDQSVPEGQSEPGRLDFTFNLSAPSVQDITVGYQIDNGSAIRGTDFRAPAGARTLVIPAGQTTATVTVETIPNLIAEPDKTFTVRTLYALGAFQVGRQNATGTILNDDVISASLAVSPVNLSEGDEGDQTPVAVTVTLSGRASQSVNLRVRTAGGTAVADTDYTALNQILTFAPLTQSQSATILVNGNDLLEPDRTFDVLLEPVGALPPYLTIAAATTPRTVTIRDDDLPTVSVDDVAQNEGDADQNDMEFTVRLSRTLANELTLSYTTVGISATAGEDYTATSGTITFAEDTDTQTITVPILGDLVIEPDETFELRISLPGGSVVTAIGTILNDDPAQLSVTKNGTRTAVSGQANSVSWTINVSNPSGSGASASVRIEDSLADLPGTVLLDSSSASANFGTPTIAGTTITWDDEIPAGETLQLTIDVVVLYDPSANPATPCLTIANPSYTFTVNGVTYPPRLGEGEVQIGDCTLGGLLALPWRLLPIRMATPTPTLTMMPTATASATPTGTLAPTVTPTSAPSATLAPTVTPTSATGAPRAPTATPSPIPSTRPSATLAPTVTSTSATGAPRAPTATPSPTPSTRPSATLAPTVTPTSAPSATLVPTVTPTSAPSATLVPTVTPTSAPSATLAPTVTPSPIPSIASSTTAEPESTAEAEATAEPDPTAEPESTAEAEATAEPESTAEAEATAEPDPTAEPEGTAEPEPTAEPEGTAEPEPTAEPESTAEAEATAEPEPTDEPESTAEAEATAEPEPTTEPELTDEPEGTAEPEPTAEPTASHIGPAATTLTTMGPVSAPIAAYTLLTVLIVAVMSRRRP